ncbi:DNA/RNA nuclease SfsA [Peptococcaceae bacterium 1198_IL3148]
MINIKTPTTIIYATFVKRENRFVATVEKNNNHYRAHVPSSGRMQELLVKGAEVILTPSAPGGRTDYKLLLVKYQGNWVSIDSLLPNRIIKKALLSDQLTELSGYQNVKSEHSFGHSRFDFFLQAGSASDCWLEVKSVTLVENGIAKFPDAPTERGAKHVLELIEAVKRGYRAVVMFVVQRSDAGCFKPHGDKDPQFAHALSLAATTGVEIYARKCDVSPEGVILGGQIPVRL